MLFRGFKLFMKVVLLLTVGLFLFMGLVEYLNITITGLQLNSLAKLSIKQACVFFEQETYKRDDTAGGLSVPNMVTRDGYVTNIGGTFYTGSDSFSVYNSLYGAGSNFISDGKVLEGNWVNYDLIRDVSSTNNALFLGEFYREAQMTPMNLGVPYVDKDVINEISKWNFGTILNNGVYNEDTGGSANIYLDNGDIYVHYKGFDVNLSNFDVTKIEYKVLNLKDYNDAKTFKDYTNMDAKTILDRVGNDDERSKVVLVGLSYKLRTKYTGVTFIGKFISGMLDKDSGVHKVQGIRLDESIIVEGLLDGTNIVIDLDVEEELEAGGFEIGTGRNSHLPVDTSVVYFIVR